MSLHERPTDDLESDAAYPAMGCGRIENEGRDSQGPASSILKE